MARIDRSKLVIGIEYYFSDKHVGKGVFVGRDQYSVYFTPTVLDGYITVGEGKWKGTVDFMARDMLRGFVEVIDSTVKDLNKIDDKEIDEMSNDWETIKDLPKKDLDYWRANAEEDYLKVPISVLRYITELEKEVMNKYSEEEVKFQANVLLNNLLFKQGFSTNIIGGLVNDWFETFRKK